MCGVNLLLEMCIALYAGAPLLLKVIGARSLGAENKCLEEILSLLEPSIVMRCQSVA